MQTERDFPPRGPEKTVKPPVELLPSLSNLDVEGRVSLEKQRRALEKKLLDLVVPPTSPLRKTIWTFAVTLARQQVESVIRNKEQVKRESLAESLVWQRAEIITERLFSLIVTEVLLPLLKLVLSREGRVKLQQYTQEYEQLRYLESLQPKIETEYLRQDK